MTFLFVLIILFCSILQGYAGTEADTYKRFNALSNTTLMAKANEFQASGKLDSALVYYTFAANRSESKIMSEEDRWSAVKSYNNLGDLYLNHFNDYVKSYAFLRRALNLSEKYGYKDIESSSKICMAVLLMRIARMNPESNLKDSVISVLSSAFEIGLEGKEPKNVHYSTYNLILSAYPVGKMAEIKPLIDKYNDFEAKNPDTTGQYISHFAQAMLDLENNDFYSATNHFNLMKQVLDNSPLQSKNLNFLLNYYSGLAEIHFKQRDIPMALEYMDSIRDLALPDSNKYMLMIVENEVCNYYEALGDKSKYNEHKLTELLLKEDIDANSDFGKLGHIHLINELDSIQDKVNALDADRRQKTTIIWIICIFTLILLFTITLIIRSYRTLHRNHQALYQLNLKIQKKEEAERKRSETLIATLKSKEDKEEEVKQKYQGNIIDEQRKEDIYMRILKKMQDSNLICQQNFTLQDLADALNEKKRDVSQVINEKYGDNFNSFLNEYRIKEACRIINDYEHSKNLTIEAIAESVGIKSRSYFATLFKNTTGLTPSEYISITKDKQGNI